MPEIEEIKEEAAPVAVASEQKTFTQLRYEAEQKERLDIFNHHLTWTGTKSVFLLYRACCPTQQKMMLWAGVTCRRTRDDAAYEIRLFTKN
jgi:hypothetical protein